MKIVFLGTGSAFTLANWQTNILVERNGKNLLIDAGSDIRHSLHAAELSYKDIDAVYISHLHGDHSQGLEYLGFCSWFDPSFKTDRGKIILYGNGDLLRRLWDKCLSGAMESVQGRMMELQDYFDVRPVRPNESFIWQDIESQLVQTIHVMNGFVIVPSYGLIAMDPDSSKRVFFTCDTQHAPAQIMDFYKMADVVIQDCETTPYCSGVHANYSELRGLPAGIKTKMVLVHSQDNVLDSSSETGLDAKWEEKAKSDGFLRFAHRGLMMDL